VPFAIVFRGPEVEHFNKSPDDMEALTLTVFNAR